MFCIDSSQIKLKKKPISAFSQSPLSCQHVIYCVKILRKNMNQLIKPLIITLSLGQLFESVKYGRKESGVSGDLIFLYGQIFVSILQIVPQIFVFGTCKKLSLWSQRALCFIANSAKAPINLLFSSMQPERKRQTIL